MKDVVPETNYVFLRADMETTVRGLQNGLWDLADILDMETNKHASSGKNRKMYHLSISYPSIFQNHVAVGKVSGSSL